MTNFTATIDVPGKGGDIGTQNVASGLFALTGGLSSGDTITFPNIIPSGGAIVRDVKLVSPELDTNATPTGTAKIGTATDDDGFVEARGLAVNASNSLTEDLALQSSNGALLNTHVTDRDIIVEIASAVATSETTGTLRLFVNLEAVPA